MGENVSRFTQPDCKSAPWSFRRGSPPLRLYQHLKPVEFDDPLVNRALPREARKLLAIASETVARYGDPVVTHKLARYQLELGATEWEVRKLLKLLTAAGLHTYGGQKWFNRKGRPVRCHCRTFRTGPLTTAWGAPMALRNWAAEHLGRGHGGARAGAGRPPKVAAKIQALGQRVELQNEFTPTLSFGEFRSFARARVANLGPEPGLGKCGAQRYDYGNANDWQTERARPRWERAGCEVQGVVWSGLPTVPWRCRADSGGVSSPCAAASRAGGRGTPRVLDPRSSGSSARALSDGSGVFGESKKVGQGVGRGGGGTHRCGSCASIVGVVQPLCVVSGFSGRSCSWEIRSRAVGLQCYSHRSARRRLVCRVEKRSAACSFSRPTGRGPPIAGALVVDGR